MKYSIYDLYDGICTCKQYYDQFEKPDTLEVGKTYKQDGVIYPLYYKILWADEKTAIAEVVGDGNNGHNVGQRDLFYNSGNMLGWKYNDNRDEYRLQEIND